MTDAKKCPQCGAELPADAPAGICPKCLLAAGMARDTDVRQQGSDESPTTPLSPSSRFVPPTPEELAKLFPQFEIVELIGAGGMGAVYKARQPALDRLVAIKILPPEVGADPSFAQRFKREAQALARLAHQHIVSVYDFGQSGGLYYFVMEYVDGANLRNLIKSGGLKATEALAIVPQICEALQFAHDEGIVHRDIKPENILVDKRGRVKIADFGLARLLGKASPDVRLTGTHQVLGTLHYMAPEQVQGSRSVDHRADIYSLGVVFYEMLTGELPLGRFDAPSQKVEVDVRLDEVVLRSLETEPQRRYQQASQLKSDVDGIRLSPSPVEKDANSADDLEALILAKLPEGFVAAIKAYRERTGANLADAKRAVEAVALRRGIALPVPRISRRLAVMVALILAAIVPLTVSVLSHRYPALKLDVSSALIGAGYVAWLSLVAWTAFRDRGTPLGWHSAITLHASFVFVFLWLAGHSQPILNALYRLTGAQPGKSDAVVFAAICLSQLLWIVPALMKLTRRLRQTPSIPAETAPVNTPGTVKGWFHMTRKPGETAGIMFLAAGLWLIMGIASYFSAEGPLWLFILIACHFAGAGLANLPRKPLQQ